AAPRPVRGGLRRARGAHGCFATGLRFRHPAGGTDPRALRARRSRHRSFAHRATPAMSGVATGCLSSNGRFLRCLLVALLVALVGCFVGHAGLDAVAAEALPGILNAGDVVTVAPDRPAVVLAQAVQLHVVAPGPWQ